MTMIENSDRGITVAKPLAWTILVALICGGLWTGLQVGRVEEVYGRLERVDVRLAAVETRTSATERAQAVADARQEEILRLLERLDGRLARIERGATEMKH